MIRGLRILAIIGLAFIGIFMTIYAWTYMAEIGSAASSYFSRREYVVAAYLLTFVGQTGFYVAFAAGVVASVASLQQRRHAWAAVFIALLVVSCYSIFFIDYLVTITGLRFMLSLVRMATVSLLGQLLVPTILAVLILVFTFTHPPATTAP
jgi:hypothetical protein